MGSLNLGHLQGMVRTAALGAVAGASVAVYIRPTSGAGAVTTAGALIGTPTLATVYSDQDGDAAITNPLTTGSDGSFACFLAPGTYDLKISGGPLSAAYGEQCKQVLGAVSDSGYAATLPGSARAYYVANATAKTALSKLQQGDLCYQVDTGVAYVYSGAAWIQMTTVPKSHGRLPLGVPNGQTGHDTEADTYQDMTLEPGTGGGEAPIWKAGEGVLFTAGDWPTSHVAKLVLIGCPDDTVGAGFVRLYDVTAGAAVASSEITLATGSGATTLKEYRSSAITLVTAHKYRAQFKFTSGTTHGVYVADAYVEIVSA